MNNKNILTLAFLTLSVLVSNAQVSIGLFSGYRMPIGVSAEDAFINKKSSTVDFRSFSKGAIPLGLAIKYLVKDKVQLECNYNYLLNIDEIYESPTNSVTITYANAIQTLKLGANYQFGNGKFKPIVGANAGLYFSNVKINVRQPNNTVDYFTYDSQTSLGIGGKAGVLYELTEKLNLDITFNYDYIFTEGTVNTKNSTGSKNLPFSNSQLFGIQLGINYKF